MVRAHSRIAKPINLKKWTTSGQIWSCEMFSNKWVKTFICSPTESEYWYGSCILKGRMKVVQRKENNYRRETRKWQSFSYKRCIGLIKTKDKSYKTCSIEETGINWFRRWRLWPPKHVIGMLLHTWSFVQKWIVSFNSTLTNWNNQGWSSWDDPNLKITFIVWAQDKSNSCAFKKTIKEVKDSSTSTLEIKTAKYKKKCQYP